MLISKIGEDFCNFFTKFAYIHGSVRRMDRYNKDDADTDYKTRQRQDLFMRILSIYSRFDKRR